MTAYAQQMTYQDLNGEQSGLFEDGALEKRCSRKLMVLLSLDIVGRPLGIHQTADGKNHEHQRELM